MSLAELQPQPVMLADPQPLSEAESSSPAPAPSPIANNGEPANEATPSEQDPTSPAPQAPPPSGQAASTTGVLKFINYYFDPSKGPHGKSGHPICKLCTDLYALTSNWPKRVGELLFAETSQHEARWLDNPTRLLTWISNYAHVEWAGGTGMVTKAMFFEHLRTACDSFEAVETLPHFPSLPNVYYVHPPLPESDGIRFEQLLSRFYPASEEDRALIQTFFLTLFWGGKPGKRPVFMFTSQDNDPHGGVGVGKSTIPELASRLVGRFIDVSLGEDITSIKKRLLSPAARGKRLVRVDNVKQRVDLADLEALITSPVISGHEMFKGEGSRPNTLVWCLTVNAATVTRDFAQRCVIIQLQRPSNNPNWFNETADFIKTYKWQIIADIGHALS